ncbi:MULTISPECIES: DUF86 domain-containing protein [Metabacillus]|uniref:DUF86 domain-containing protein n=1 Tax=Metabacillus hrfriensis TaxID=3048891 RepID=A0ACD4RA65_9BACI|nr:MULTISPECIES: DUF86 domain-containing protein [Metabacillus]UAL51720.1 DUF86 domain-containing protein [Metabacillus dongyingensis]USK28027.1 DUF86 domain-containing protein [Bacillus sp. CMF21]WHZ57233.1 DUF86 domain-containing protein [Metabacillus sp. CT-WN-B3]
MYFVDREKIEETLVYFEKNLTLFAEHKEWKTDIEVKALERLAQMIIEAILDTGNAIIDGFIMRDPGSYEDIIDIMLDEKVVAAAEADGLKEVIGFRKQLVQEYLFIDHTALKDIFNKQSVVLDGFPSRVRAYLENELGPVSAFRH